MNKEKFRIRLKYLREQKGLTQEQVGKRINFEKQTICNYEAGTRTPDEFTLDKLSQIFGVDKAYLKGEVDFLNNIELAQLILEEFIKHRIIEESKPIDAKTKKNILIIVRNAIKTYKELDL